MPAALTRRITLLTGAAACLGGCARQAPIVLDRQAMQSIKRIGLPSVGVSRSPDVRVVNGISTQMAGFGLIGAIGNLSGSIVRGNRSDAVVAMMAARNFSPGPALTAMLADKLRQSGFTPVEFATDPKRGFMASITPSPAYDAVLDCTIAGYGFTALNDSDDSPYRANVIVPARLVGPDGAVLMQDRVVVSAGSEPQDGRPGDPPPAPNPAAGTFRSFSDVEKDPAAGVEALRAVFEAAATGIVRRIT